jgi:outer membrane murein-binding lipoprotein Lpp
MKSFKSFLERGLHKPSLRVIGNTLFLCLIPLAGSLFLSGCTGESSLAGKDLVEMERKNQELAARLEELKSRNDELSKERESLMDKVTNFKPLLDQLKQQALSIDAEELRQLREQVRIISDKNLGLEEKLALSLDQVAKMSPQVEEWRQKYLRLETQDILEMKKTIDRLTDDNLTLENRLTLTLTELGRLSPQLDKLTKGALKLDELGLDPETISRIVSQVNGAQTSEEKSLALIQSILPSVTQKLNKDGRGGSSSQALESISMQLIPTLLSSQTGAKTDQTEALTQALLKTLGNQAQGTNSNGAPPTTEQTVAALAASMLAEETGSDPALANAILQLTQSSLNKKGNKGTAPSAVKTNSPAVSTPPAAPVNDPFADALNKLLKDL